MRALDGFFFIFFLKLIQIHASPGCGTNAYPVNVTTCAACPDNTVSPAYSESIMECSPKAGYYGWPGQAAQECSWNQFCPQGVTHPATCPPGTRSDPGMSRCVPGSKSVVLFDWITGVTWGTLFLTALVVMGVYRKLIFHDLSKQGDGTAREIKIKISW
jgi:hypothetical protein